MQRSASQQRVGCSAHIPLVLSFALVGSVRRAPTFGPGDGKLWDQATLDRGDRFHQERTDGSPLLAVGLACGGSGGIPGLNPGVFSCLSLLPLCGQSKVAACSGPALLLTPPQEVALSHYRVPGPPGPPDHLRGSSHCSDACRPSRAALGSPAQGHLAIGGAWQCVHIAVARAAGMVLHAGTLQVLHLQVHAARDGADALPQAA